MKTMNRILIMIAVLAFLVPVITMAQATIINKTKKVATIKSLGQGDEIVINPGKPGHIGFAPSSGEFKFKLFRRDGQNDVLVGITSLQIVKGIAELTSADMFGVKTVKAVAPETVPENISPTQAKIIAPSGLASKAPTTTLMIVDSTDNRMELLTSVAAGVALKPGQMTEDFFTFETGKNEITLLLPAQPDSTDSGREYYQAVFSSIIVQGQKLLVIKNENISRTGGSLIRLRIQSLVGFPFEFTAGPWKGEGLAYRDFTDKKDLKEGFNSIGVTFKGINDGLKYQGTFEILVTKHTRSLKLRPSDLHNIKAIPQSPYRR